MRTPRWLHNQMKHNNYNVCRDLIDSGDSGEACQANPGFPTNSGNCSFVCSDTTVGTCGSHSVVSSNTMGKDSRWATETCY